MDANFCKRHRPSMTEEAIRFDDEDLLDLPAGWLVQLVTFQAELIASSFLSLISPFLYLYFQSREIPVRVVRGAAALARRFAIGLLGALYAATFLLALMLISLLLGVALVRMWAEEPVLLRRSLHLDYTEVNPTASVALAGSTLRSGRAVPPGHSVTVSLFILLPESDYNRLIGVFQVQAEVISSTGEIIAASSRPCMLRFRSFPVRLMRTLFMSIPLLLGISSETQEIGMEVLKYKESRAKRSGSITVTLKPKAGTSDLPQLYESELLMRSQLPWPKELVNRWRWTFSVWTSLNVFFALLAASACCFKFRPRRSKREGEREMESRFGWSERSKRKVSEARRRPELVEGSASSTGGDVVEGGDQASESLDDSGELAASESSECKSLYYP
ncbi:seipin-1-like [Curcuma longa]|uniref:seipin-1-like n=1 Tax=Curcuma longa TaxID=136217 RepID=UPI003D9F3EF0